MKILNEEDQTSYDGYIDELVDTIYENDQYYHQMMLETWEPGTVDGRWTQEQIDTIDNIISDNSTGSIFTGPAELLLQCNFSEIDEDDGLIPEGTTLNKYGQYLEVYKGKKVIRENGEYILETD